jgi:hypothetical protein
MKEEAKLRGGAITNISNIEVTYGTDGQTSRLVFSTNQGSLTVSGEEFYQIFNLRAPAKISLKSRLFNIERRQ